MATHAPSIPESLPLFGGYIVNADDRLQAINPATTNKYHVDFGISVTQATQITTYRTTWGTTYASAISLPNCPPDVKRDAHTFRDQVAKYFKDEKILEKIKASNMANATDEMIFHIDLVKSDPTFHTVPISDAIYAFVTAGGEGQLDIFCRTVNDSSRASIPVAHGANTIQYAYKIFDGMQAVPLTPFQPDSAWMMDTNSRAHFKLNVGTQWVGKWVVIYFRWYNTKHPNIAGGWSGIYQKVLG